MNGKESMLISDSIKKVLDEDIRFKILFYLQEHKKTKVYELGKKFKLTPSRVHQIVKSLDKAKAIKVTQKIVNGRVCNYAELKHAGVSE